MEYSTMRLQLWIVMLSVAVTISERCPLATTTDFNFTLATRRNSTGHWIIMVEASTADALNTTAGDQQRHRETSLLVGQHTSICDNMEVTKLTATACMVPTSGSGTGSDGDHGVTAKTSPSSLAHAAGSGHLSILPESKCRHPEGYELVDSQGYYKAYHTEKPWYAARAVCEKDGAHLMVIDSEQENVVLRTMFDRRPGYLGHGYMFAIGVSDLQEEGEYVTVLGESVPYTNWGPGEPDGGTLWNCVIVWTDLTWGDYPCLESLPFVCEFSAVHNCT